MNNLLTKTSHAALDNLDDIRAGIKSLFYKDPHARVKRETTYCPRETPEEQRGGSGYVPVPLAIQEILEDTDLYVDERERKIEAKRFEYYKAYYTGSDLTPGKPAGKNNKHIHPYSWEPEDYLFGEDYDKAEDAYDGNQRKAITVLLIGLLSVIALTVKGFSSGK